MNAGDGEAWAALSKLPQERHGEVFAVRMGEVVEGKARLEAAFYGSDGFRAARTLKNAGFDSDAVGSLADIRWYGPMPRVYVDSEVTGVPFYSSAEMLEAQLNPKAWLSRTLTPKLSSLMVREGQILISRSGTIGNIAFCTADYDGVSVSEHAIRVIPHDPAHVGVVLCFLMSEIGQFFLKTSKSGSVVNSLYEQDVATLTVPRLPTALRSELTRLVREAATLRVAANRTLAEAQDEVQRSCYLPDLSSLQPRGRVVCECDADVFAVSASERLPMSAQFGEFRLDASYHLPLADALRRHILAKQGGQELSQVIKGVRNSGLRKRVYVDDPALGVQMLGGKQLMQTRPHDVKLLSRVLTRNLASETVGAGWTLVSSGGTLGRCLFVHRNLEGATVSQDVMRIIPDPAKALPGFIFAFLASPYGQIQIRQRGYGSVIPRLRDFQFNSIAIRLPKDKGEAIHQKVVHAFDLRADAKAKEDSAIKLFMSALANGRAYVESEWGKEY